MAILGKEKVLNKALNECCAFLCKEKDAKSLAYFLPLRRGRGAIPCEDVPFAKEKQCLCKGEGKADSKSL